MENQNKEVCITSWKDDTLVRVAIHNTRTHKVEIYNCTPISMDDVKDGALVE